MSDLLSGGVIDDSTSGPVPSNVDDRKTDIIAEQSENQRQNAIGGTESPPTPSQPQQIQPPPQIAPPLPAIPSFDFNIKGSAIEETREIARQATIDVIKNVTINGQGPSIDGSSISFNVSQSAPASEVFSFQGIVEVRPQPVNANNITDISIAPPARTSELSTQAPQIAESKNESISEQRDRENGARETRDQEIRTSLGLDPTPVLDQPSEPATPKGKSISEQNEEEGTARAQADREVRASAGLEGESPMDETDDTYQKAQAAGRAKRESDPDFDRESDVRQKGERHSEFKERQETLKEERAERLKLAEEKATFAKRAKDGSIGETPSGMVPVALTRADGARRILAYLASEFVGVVEGAEDGERVTNLPSENSYYEAGGDSCIGLGLYKKTVGTPPNTSTEVWIGAGTIAGQVPSGFDPADGKLIASGGSGSVWAEVNIDQETGELVSVAVDGGSSTPQNTDTSFYYTLGYYEYDGSDTSVTNYGCGSIDVSVCRNWFAAESPYYGVSLSRCGCGGGGGGGGY